MKNVINKVGKEAIIADTIIVINYIDFVIMHATPGRIDLKAQKELMVYGIHMVFLRRYK